MITLKESLLDKKSNQIKNTKEALERTKYLGAHFEVESSLIFVRPRDVEGMSLRNLNKHIKPDVFWGAEEEMSPFCQKRAIQLCKYIYAIDLEKMGIEWDKIVTDPKVSNDFFVKLEEKMVEDGIFKEGDYYIYGNNKDSRKYSAADLTITFIRQDKWANFTIGFNEKER